MVTDNKHIMDIELILTEKQREEGFPEEFRNPYLPCPHCSRKGIEVKILYAMTTRDGSVKKIPKYYVNHDPRKCPNKRAGKIGLNIHLNLVPSLHKIWDRLIPKFNNLADHD